MKLNTKKLSQKKPCTNNLLGNMIYELQNSIIRVVYGARDIGQLFE